VNLNGLMSSSPSEDMAEAKWLCLAMSMPDVDHEVYTSLSSIDTVISTNDYHRRLEWNKISRTAEQPPVHPAINNSDKGSGKLQRIINCPQYLNCIEPRY